MATKRCTSKRTGKKVSCARQRAGKKAASSRRAGGRRATSLKEGDTVVWSEAVRTKAGKARKDGKRVHYTGVIKGFTEFMGSKEAEVRVLTMDGEPVGFEGMSFTNIISPSQLTRAGGGSSARGQRAGAGGKGRYALVKSEGMDQWILSRHTTEAAAEKAMRKRGGEPGSMFTRGMKIYKVGPDDPHEAIKIFGRWTIRGKGLFARFTRGHRAVDKVAARELELFIDNDYQLTNRRKPEFIKNALRKVKSGKYSVALAPKLWIYYVDEGAWASAG